MIQEIIAPKPDCKACHGSGELPGDSVPVPFGSGSCRTPNVLCDCVIEQSKYEDDESEIVIRKVEPSRGWNYLVNSPKWHYFIDARSLCGRWLGFGLTGFDDDPATDKSADNCAGCVKRLAKLRATEEKERKQ